MTSLLDGFPLNAQDGRDEAQIADPEPVAPASIPESAAEPSPAPLVVLEGNRMSERDQMFATLTHAFRVARRNYLKVAERDGSIIHGLMRGQPPSVHDEHEYAKGRAWVPPSHDGGTLEGMGDIYHWVIARPGVAYGNSVSAIAHKPFRACIAAGIALIVAVPVLLATGHRFAAIMTGVGAGTLTALWIAAGYLLSRVRRRLAEARTFIRDDETDEES